MFSILVDERKEISKVEQMAIIVQFIDNVPSVNEWFLTQIPAENLTATGLSTYILNCLEKYGLHYKWIIAQWYDGASVMSGSCSGVQARIKQLAPHAEYIHCNAHCLNLCLVDCVKSVHSADKFFALVQN